MNPHKVLRAPRRVSSGRDDDLDELLPFQKITVTPPASVYYLDTPTFPMRERERGKIKELIISLAGRFPGDERQQLFSYLGIIHSMLRPELLRAISMNKLEWRPMTALALLPGQPPPRIPDVEEVVERGGDISPDEVLPAITYITKQSAVREASDRLFGMGALAIYVTSLEEQQFFRKTKEVFGHTIEDDALKFMNCLPFFAMDALMRATERQFRALFSVLELYIGESARDMGYIIISNKCLDDEIIELVSLFKSRDISF
jgi:hypothetical protein